jgi:hypothetical protein
MKYSLLLIILCLLAASPACSIVRGGAAKNGGGSGDTSINESNRSATGGGGAQSTAGPTVGNKPPTFDRQQPEEVRLENHNEKILDPAIKRVRFAVGATSAIISGKITDAVNVSYLVGARVGQTLTVEVIDGGGDVVVDVARKDGGWLSFDDASGDVWRGRLPITGDFVISVNTVESKESDFKIRITIR